MTVNNQIVVGTLMNICDDPNRVSAGQDWREQEYLRRIPIIVTGEWRPLPRRRVPSMLQPVIISLHVLLSNGSGNIAVAC